MPILIIISANITVSSPRTARPLWLPTLEAMGFDLAAKGENTSHIPNSEAVDAMKNQLPLVIMQTTANSSIRLMLNEESVQRP